MVKRFKLFALAIFFLLSACSTTACFDRQEMNDVSFVAVIGVDQGITNKWRLTLQIPTMTANAQTGAQTGGGSSQGGDGGGGESNSGNEANQGNYSFITIEAPSFFSGINILNATVPKKLNFSHTKLIIFSEDLAKSGLIEPYIAPLSRFRELRYTAHIFVVKGTAQDFIKENRPVISATISKTFEELAKGSLNSGYYPNITFQEFYQSLKSPYGQAIASMAAVNELKNLPEEGKPFGTEFKPGGDYKAGELPRFSQSKIEIWGTALFDGAKMVDELTGDETRHLLMIRGEFKQGYFNIQDPNQPDLIIPLDVRAVKAPKVKVNTKGTKPKIYLKLHLDGELLAVQSMINYEKKEQTAQLEKIFAQEVKKNVVDLIKRCQAKDLDVFYFGDYAGRNFLTIQKLDAYDWNRQFRDAEVSVDVEFVIRRTGTQIKSSPVKGVGG